MTDENYTGTRPFYCLIVGPTSEVVNICNVLNDSLKGSGLQSGRDFDYLTRAFEARTSVYSYQQDGRGQCGT